jgi:hypothetical protein
MNFFDKIQLAITRNPKRFVISLFFGITTLWALLEPFITVCFPGINKYWFVVTFLILSLIIAIIRVYPKNSIRIILNNTNTIVNVKFGDLFEEKGNIAIAVNEYFDSEIGKPVSDKSIHGILITKILGGRSELFDKAINETLSDVPYVENKRALGKSKIYPIGSTASLKYGDKNYLLFALAKTNDKYEAHTSPGLLFDALEGLFDKARSECNGYELSLPLIGTGLSRSGIPAKYIVELLLISILKATSISEITRTINIVIDDFHFDQIDLNRIEQEWSYINHLLK